jgi:hypothetical protein
MKIVATVWTGVRSVKVKGKVIDVPRVPVYDDNVSQYGVGPERATRTFQTVKLFRADNPVRMIRRTGNHRAKWWIYYAPDHMTGGFDTKREAIAWRYNGGK